MPEIIDIKARSVLDEMKQSLGSIEEDTAKIKSFFEGDIEDRMEGKRADKLKAKEEKEQTKTLKDIAKNVKGKKEKDSNMGWVKLLGLLGAWGAMNLPLTVEHAVKTAVDALKDAGDVITKDPKKAAKYAALGMGAGATLETGRRAYFNRKREKAAKEFRAQQLRNLGMPDAEIKKQLVVEKAETNAHKENAKVNKKRLDNLNKAKRMPDKVTGKGMGLGSLDNRLKLAEAKTKIHPSIFHQATKLGPSAGRKIFQGTAGGADLTPVDERAAFKTTPEARADKAIQKTQKEIKAVEKKVIKADQKIKTKPTGGPRTPVALKVINKVIGPALLGVNLIDEFTGIQFHPSALLPNRDAITDELKIGGATPLITTRTVDPNKTATSKIVDATLDTALAFEPTQIMQSIHEGQVMDQNAKVRKWTSGKTATKEGGSPTFGRAIVRDADGKIKYEISGLSEKEVTPWYGKKEVKAVWNKLRDTWNFLYGDAEEGKAGKARMKKSIKANVAANPALAELLHISGSAFAAQSEDPMRITSGFRNEERQRKAMENQRKRNPRQYAINYMGGKRGDEASIKRAIGRITDKSTDEWMKKRMSKHQHGNGVDVAYPNGITPGSPEALAFVDSINQKFVAAGFDGNAAGEGNHIHLNTGATPSREQAAKFESLHKQIMAYQTNNTGNVLDSLNQNGAGAGGLGGSGTQVNIEGDTNVSNGQEIVIPSQGVTNPKHGGVSTYNPNPNFGFGFGAR